jgi:hypothetical protein
MVVKASMALPILSLSGCGQQEKETTQQQSFAWKSHCTTSWLGNPKRRGNAAMISP